MLKSVVAFRVSDGERNVFLSYLGVSAVGAFLAFFAGLTLEGAATLATFPDLYDIWLALSGAIGAASALSMGRRFLGRSDLLGAVQVLLVFPMITLIAALIAGSLALPIYGTMFGPLALVTTLISNPFLAGVWITAIFGAHAAYAIYREEREVFFTTSRTDRIAG